jgi:hypothetical protein
MYPEQTNRVRHDVHTEGETRSAAGSRLGVADVPPVPFGLGRPGPRPVDMCAQGRGRVTPRCFWYFPPRSL